MSAMHRGTRLALVGALALLLGGPAPRALAQPAAALGKPLPLTSLPVGSISVRVIAGAVSKPVTGVEVTLTVDGTPRTARTDATGRALFAGVPLGASVRAAVTTASDGGDAPTTVTSEAFALDGSSGVAVMLSTSPMTGGGAAPFAGGAAGMPEPRRASGQPQAFPGDGAGTITVALSYNDLADPSPPTAVPVTLIGYAADDSVTVATQQVDARGVARFAGLDVSGSTAYYAAALLPRGGAVDRLQSQPITLGEIGVRVILSSVKRDDGAPPIDDSTLLDEPVAGAVAGAITVRLAVGGPDAGVPIELVDAATGKVVATRMTPPTRPAGRHLEGSFTEATPDPTMTAGSFDVTVLAGGGDDRGPVPGVAVYVEPVDAPPPAGSAAPVAARQTMQGNTGDDGVAHVAGLAPGAWRVRIAAPGTDGVTSAPFVVATTGGARMVAQLQLRDGVPARVVEFSAADVAAAGATAYYAQVRFGDALVRSAPLVPTPTLPTSATLEAYAPLMFQFQLDGGVDDKYLAMQGQFAIFNRLHRPYLDTPDGMLVPIPRGATGAIVDKEDESMVTPERGGTPGFRIRRALPPRGLGFRAGFSLPIDHGVVQWNYDLPFGAVQSRLAIVENPGMRVELPPGVEGEHRRTDAGLAFFRVADIEIPPGQRMALRLTGLPALPAWKIWLPRIVGLVALGIMALGLALALGFRRRSAAAATAAATAARVEVLMAELVTLERAGGDPTRRAEVMAELERIWPTKAPARGGATAS